MYDLGERAPLASQRRAARALVRGALPESDRTDQAPAGRDLEGGEHLLVGAVEAEEQRAEPRVVRAEQQRKRAERRIDDPVGRRPRVLALSGKAGRGLVDLAVALEVGGGVRYRQHDDRRSEQTAGAGIGAPVLIAHGRPEAGPRGR